MQPYFFPYIGYWQLIQSVDRFVVYDDVNYKKGGWINRNRILINGQSCYFTVPLDDASANKKICEIGLSGNKTWRGKLLKKVELSYRRAPYFNDVFPIILEIVSHENENLAGYIFFQLKKMTEFLNLKTEIVQTSQKYLNTLLSSEERVIDICKKEKAKTYINLPGGKNLYNAATFKREQIDLGFIEPHFFQYQQRSEGFCADLSIIDSLMELGEHGVKKLLAEYDLHFDGIVS
jgi:hypothetical protein